MNRLSIFLIICGLLFVKKISAENITEGNWTISMNPDKSFGIEYNGKSILKNVEVCISTAPGINLHSTSYPKVELSKQFIDDSFGKGMKYIYRFHGIPGKEEIEEVFYFYPDRKFFFVESYLCADTSTTQTNRISPLFTCTSTSLLPGNGDNRILKMPFDNDMWRGYDSVKCDTVHDSVISCEVGALYDAVSSAGFIIGSIEHNTWKTGIEIKTADNSTISYLDVFGGLISEDTNDLLPDKPQIHHHGFVKGEKVKSPKIFIGFYDDWKDGMEEIGKATATLQPPLPWNNGTIFGWQSWGGMAERVNFEGASDVADYFKHILHPSGFHNENDDTYIVLDSFWDNLSEEELIAFASDCHKRGQHPGIYWTPFSFWGNEQDLDRILPGIGNENTTYRDVILTANGKPRKISAISIDPTHPAVARMIDWQMKRFHDWGYDYVKFDFLNNASVEADKFANEDITTGMMAYDYGMKYLSGKAMQYDMFMDLSIAPCFPAYGHARRISCDAWNTVTFSQYVLNSLGLGWWLDRVYRFNDPDHIVLRDVSEGENRIRYTTGVMTGTLLLGDNLSKKGSFIDINAEENRNKVEKIASNIEINNVARIGKSFRPVSGKMDTEFSLYGKTYHVDNIFCLKTDTSIYISIFNFKDYDQNMSIDMSEIGIEGSDVTEIKELWTSDSLIFTHDKINIQVPSIDVRLIKIDLSKSLDRL